MGVPCWMVHPACTTQYMLDGSMYCIPRSTRMALAGWFLRLARPSNSHLLEGFMGLCASKPPVLPPPLRRMAAGRACVQCNAAIDRTRLAGSR